MSKTEVYSWRVDPELKRKLEAKARAEKKSVGAVIESACRTLLEHSDANAEAGESKLARRRLVLLEIFEAARLSDPGGPPTESATNANVRKAFSAKLASDRKKWSRRAG
jgi:predicted transcriptional regulator